VSKTLVGRGGGGRRRGKGGYCTFAQQSSAPAFIAADRPVTAEQVREKLQSDGWSNVVVSRNGKYIEATGSLNGEAGKMAVDSQTGRLRAADDEDDD
jgi:hypothetical protein